MAGDKKSSAKDKLLLKLKPLRSRLPSLEELKQALKATVLIMVGLSLTTLFIAKVPELHDSYIRAEVGSRVFKIQVDPKSGGGTGFQVKAPSGTNYIMTNAHVCQYIEEKDTPENSQTAVVAQDDGSWVRRRIVAISGESDLCLIEGVPGVNGLSLGSDFDIGDHMMVVGHPHLKPITLSSGEVIGFEDVTMLDYVIAVKNNPLVAQLLPAKGGACDLPKNSISVIKIPKDYGGGEVDLCFVNIKNTTSTSIVIYPGNSGSPMVNFWGHVTGVAFAADDSDNYAAVTSLDDIKTFMSRY